MTDTSADTTRLVRTQGVTAPAGFRATGIAAGIKASGALDLALVFNEGPDYGAAGVFTRNQVKAAPVLWSQQVLSTAMSGRPPPGDPSDFPQASRGPRWARLIPATRRTELRAARSSAGPSAAGSLD